MADIEKKKMNLMRVIPLGKIIVVAFSAGESSAKMLDIVIKMFGHTHRIIVTFCNTGEEDEESLIFAKKIAEYYNIEVIWLEFDGHLGFKIVDFDTAYRKTEYEKDNGFPNHPFRKYIEHYGLPQYPNRTRTREMKERTISRYLSSIGAKPRFVVRCVGIRFDEIDDRTPSPTQYYPLILAGVTKKQVNAYFEKDMPFRLQIPSYLGNCGACISKSLKGLCTIARHTPEKFDFFEYITKEYGKEGHTFYRNRKSIGDIFEMSKDEKIKDAHDNRFDLPEDYEFDPELDTEGACGGTCEAFS